MIQHSELTLAHVADGRQVDVIGGSGTVWRVRRVRSRPPCYIAKFGETKFYEASLADLRVTLSRS